MQFAYTHPLINKDVGRKKSDPQNQANINLVLRRYQQWFLKTTGQSLQYDIDRMQYQRAKIIFPLAGLLAGLIGSFGFVHKNSKFIGKFFIAGMGVGGYWVAQRYEKSHNVFATFQNYDKYPKDIQKMVDNNDCRYAHRWLKDNYLQIQP